LTPWTGDKTYGSINVLDKWFDYWDFYQYYGFVYAWMQANFDNLADNASAIDVSVTPRVAYHLKRLGFMTWQIEAVTEDKWVGTDN